MGKPSKEEVEWSLSALRDHAKDWDTASNDLQDIIGKVHGLRVNRIEAGLFQSLVNTVNSTVQRVNDRCSEGVKETKAVGEALLKVARVYEEEEEANVHRIRKLY